MQINYSELPDQLKKNKIATVYLFAGEEIFFKQEAIKRIEKVLLPEESKQFNYHRYLASDTPPETIIETLNTLPFLAEKRLVIVEDIDEWKEAEENVFLSYLDKPSGNSCALLTTKRLDYKNPIYKKINQVGMVVEFKNLYGKEITDWIKERFKDGGKTISPEAIEILLELTGNNLFSLNSEIEKICLYKKDEGKEIDQETILSLNTEGRVYQIKELNQTLFRNKLEQALKILNNLLIEGEQPLKILGAISHQIRQFIYALALREQGLSVEEIKTRLRIYKSAERIFFEQLRKCDKEILIKLLEECLAADYQIKTGQKTAQIVLENLILQLSAK